MEGDTNKLLKLTPFADEKVWGGEYLKKAKNIRSSNLIGETLEISTLSNKNSLYEGTELSKIVGEIPYLVKFIETTDNLSIQVHPGDEYAKKVENSRGKTECWLILEAKKGAGIYLGFKHGVKRDEFETAIKEEKAVNDFLEFYLEIRDFFSFQGAIHAIGSGVSVEVNKVVVLLTVSGTGIVKD